MRETKHYFFHKNLSFIIDLGTPHGHIILGLKRYGEHIYGRFVEKVRFEIGLKIFLLLKSVSFLQIKYFNFILRNFKYIICAFCLIGQIQEKI